MRSTLPAILLILTTACASGPDSAPPGTNPTASATTNPRTTYWVYVGAESADLLHRIRFGPGGAQVERTIPVGRMPTENEGPHGIGISPDGKYLYLTTGHGVPDGKIWKYELGPDTVVAPEIGLGYFPATVDVTPDGLFALVANFNLHGEHVPSTVSVVYTPDMREVGQTQTCTMPHGSRINPQGTRHYSACMMDDRVVEIDTRTFRPARAFSVAVGEEGPVPVREDPHEMDDHGGDGHKARQPSCSPTWTEPSADGSRVYVACNKADLIHELDVDGWRITRTFGTGQGPYNLEVTPDGRLLIATLKKQGAVQVFDLESGEALATMPSTTTVTHGVVASPDSRYAFVSVEGVGGEPGKVDIYDLRTLELVQSVEVGQQAGGIGFWRMQ